MEWYRKRTLGGVLDEAVRRWGGGSPAARPAAALTRPPRRQATAGLWADDVGAADVVPAV